MHFERSKICSWKKSFLYQLNLLETLTHVHHKANNLIENSPENANNKVFTWNWKFQWREYGNVDFEETKTNWLKACGLSGDFEAKTFCSQVSWTCLLFTLKSLLNFVNFLFLWAKLSIPLRNKFVFFFVCTQLKLENKKEKK